MTDQNIEKVAVLGAGGMMGFAIAQNLTTGGFQVRAWNRSREKAEPLTENGTVVCDTPAEAAEGADLVLTMLADADAVLSVAEEAFSASDGESDQPVWLQTSTIGERGTERCQELASQHDIAFVDAPVLGSKEPAKERKLVILASGPPELQERLEPLFGAISQRTM